MLKKRFVENIIQLSITFCFHSSLGPTILRYETYKKNIQRSVDHLIDFGPMSHYISVLRTASARISVYLKEHNIHPAQKTFLHYKLEKKRDEMHEERKILNFRSLKLQHTQVRLTRR
jgi:hypothetical protein